MDSIFSVLGELFKVWKGMFDFALEYIPKILILILWIISGLFILPCVFVAGTFYPKWTDWGDKL